MQENGSTQAIRASEYFCMLECRLLRPAQAVVTLHKVSCLQINEPKLARRSFGYSTQNHPFTGGQHWEDRSQDAEHGARGVGEAELERAVGQDLLVAHDRRREKWAGTW